MSLSMWLTKMKSRKEPDAADLALKRCTLKDDLTLATEFWMFYKAHTSVGTVLTLTEEDLAYLDETLAGAADLFDDAKDRETTYTGVAVYFGTLAMMTLGGDWAHVGDGKYMVQDLGPDKASMDPFDIVRTVVASSGADSLQNQYAGLKGSF